MTSQLIGKNEQQQQKMKISFFFFVVFAHPTWMHTLFLYKIDV